nr:grasp-with-spasm system SPASM domain peptide maturase [uncultured Flavobacterium sp.]
MINKKFILFQCCIPIKGINNGVIVDFQRKSIYKVSNQIIDILNEYQNKKLLNLFFDFRLNKDILKKYIRFFLNNELIIITENTNTFPAIEPIYNKPYQLEIVTIEILELSSYSDSFFEKTLDKLGVKCLRLIIRKNIISNIEQILKYLNYSKVQSITLFLEYEKGLELIIKKIKRQNPRLASIIFYNFKTKVKIIKNDLIYFDPLPLEKVLYKGIQGSNDFSLNLNIYIESLSHNVGFNKTIFIDHFGDIKKHILDEENYGNISNEFDIENALKNESIISFWNITKDKIETCKDCEFRHICTDNRIPFKKNEDKYYSHSESCNYNPYINKWLEKS